MRFYLSVFLFILFSNFLLSQTAYRGSIPEELIRPKKGESPYYPSDLIIGELGRGNASAEAYEAASLIGNGFLSGLMNNTALSSINSVMRESLLSALNEIEPEKFRIGGGRQETDGAVSFLVRFIGKELSITGELYLRGDDQASNFRFEEMLLDEPKDREMEIREITTRSDYNPYERFY